MSPTVGAMHSRTRFALFAALGTCFFGLAVSLSFAWWVSDLLLAPPWYEHRSPEQGLRLGNSTDPRTDFGIEFEDVTFPTGEDATLRGWFIPGAAGAESVVVGAHGAGGDRRSFIGLVPMFHEAGYPVLLFDFRDHGVSDGAARRIGEISGLLGLGWGSDHDPSVKWKLSSSL